MIDTIVVTPSDEDATARLWAFLDASLEQNAWITLFARDHHTQLRRDVERWVAVRRAGGHRLAVEETRICQDGSVTPIYSVHVGHRTFLSIHFPTTRFGFDVSDAPCTEVP
jgi:hypothetical protein